MSTEVFRPHHDSNLVLGPALHMRKIKTKRKEIAMRAEDGAESQHRVSFPEVVKAVETLLAEEIASNRKAAENDMLKRVQLLECMKRMPPIIAIALERRLPK